MQCRPREGGKQPCGRGRGGDEEGGKCHETPPLHSSPVFTHRMDTLLVGKGQATSSDLGNWWQIMAAGGKEEWKSLIPGGGTGKLSKVRWHGTCIGLRFNPNIREGPTPHCLVELSQRAWKTSHSRTAGMGQEKNTRSPQGAEALNCRAEQTALGKRPLT